ncbi:S-protein homolog 74 [Linum grandiflorum]
MAGPSMGTAVYVKNGLRSELAVIVHCQSKNDDLKAHVVQFGSWVEWTFGVSWTTLFWCDLALQDKRLHFDAFLPSAISADDPDAYWIVRDLGVYSNDTKGQETLSVSWSC